MRDEAWQRIGQTVLDHIAARTPWTTDATQIPIEEYTSRDRLCAERRMIESRPQMVGLSADVSDSGSYFTRDNLAIPLVVIRGDDGVARAFANVCVHRCAQVVTESRGRSRRHTCPFHGWTYASDGQLVGLTSRESFPHVDLDAERLTPLPTWEQHGVIWVALDPAAHGGVGPDIDAFGDDFDELGVAEHEHWRTRRFELEMNWKLVLDTFMESYHVATLHPQTAAPIFLADLQVNDSHGPHMRSVVPRRNFTELAEQDPETWDLRTYSTLVYYLFPNSILMYQKDHIETWRITPHPTEPARCSAEFDLYVPKGETGDASQRYWEKCWQLIIDTIEQEDFAAMSGVQRGVSTGVIDHLKIGANESGLKMFHDAINDALAQWE